MGNPNKDKILITGGAGFIGSQVVRAYLQAGYQVVVVDDFSRGKRERLPEGVRVYKADICDLDILSEIFARERPTMVSHHAALVSVRESYKNPDPYYRVIINGTRSVIEACKGVELQKFIFASSGGAIYGDVAEMPIKESVRQLPLSPYGDYKGIAEILINLWETKTERVILRYGNVYGPGQDALQNNGVIAIFTHALLNGEQPVIYGDGLQTRDYIHIHDVVEANLAALEPGVTGVFNIGAGQGFTLGEIFRKIADQLGMEGVSPAYLPANRYEVLHNVLDIGRAKNDLGWQPRISLDQGLRETIQTIAEEQREEYVSD